MHPEEARIYGRELLDALRKQQIDMDDALWLVKNGASFEIADARGDTALHIAARMQLPTLVREMLIRGADPETPNTAGNTPIIIAATGGGEVLYHLLSAKPAVHHRNNGGNDALTCAVAAHKTDNMHQLLAAGARPDQKLLNMAERLGRHDMLPDLQVAQKRQQAAFVTRSTTTARDVSVINMPPPRRPKP